jgi:hypothetical protein
LDHVTAVFPTSVRWAHHLWTSYELQHNINLDELRLELRPRFGGFNSIVTIFGNDMGCNRICTG